MANKKSHSGANVPALRFPEFSGEWKMVSLQDIAIINPKSSSLHSVFYYIDLESVEKGELKKRQEIHREEAPSRAQRVIGINDILFQCVRPYQKNNYINRIQDTSSEQWVASTGYAQIRTTETPNYIYHLLNTDGFNAKVLIRCTGSSYPAINSEDLATIRFYISADRIEQLKISRLLDLLDERIATQSRIIEEQETLLKSLRVDLLNHAAFTAKQQKIRDILTIAGGKDYQHLDDGDIPVYGTGGLMCYVSSYLYDGESVCIGRKGTINKPFYLNGRFWTVDTLFYTHSFNGIRPRYCYHLFCTIDWLAYNEASGVPSLSKSTIEKITVSVPAIETQDKIVSILDAVEHKIHMDRSVLRSYEVQKNYLLSRMFI